MQTRYRDIPACVTAEICRSTGAGPLRTRCRWSPACAHDDTELQDA
jgi:hypothetical protein